MKNYRKEFFIISLSIILSYFVTRLYDNLLIVLIPKEVYQSSYFWIFSSTIIILILMSIIYFIIYHDRKDFLKWRSEK